MNAYSETSDKITGAAATIILHALLIFWFAMHVITVENPEPMGDGNTLEVSYGFDEKGQGNTEEIPMSPKEQQSTSSSEESSTNEQLLADENAEADIVVKKQIEKPKEKKNKTKVDSKPTDEKKQEKQVDSDVKNLGDFLKNGGDGNDGVEGNVGGGGEDLGRGRGKGKGGKGGIGNGVTLVSKHQQRHATYDCQQEGIQKVKVKINRQGYVVSATGNQAGTTNEAACLKTKAEKIAREETYNADPQGDEFRYHITTFDFYLQ